MKMMNKLKGFSEKKFSDKIDQLFKLKKTTKKNRLLITINVLGSCGPIRLVVNEDENTGAVIDAALKVYGREGRLPILGSDVNSFSLYPAFAEYDYVLKSSEAIGCGGARNFVLCKMESKITMSTETRSNVINQKGGGWRAWLQKSLSLKIPSH
ncbi:hypothetical protein ACS0TY_029167 [Phlomoides rotata]